MAYLAFLKDNFSLILYGIALVISVFRYRRYFDSKLKYFPILIGYTFCTEILGMLIKREEAFSIFFSKENELSNNLIYNIFDIFFYLYFFYIYWYAIKNTQHKRWIKNGGILFLAVSLINPFFQNFIFIPQIYSMIAGSATITLASILYLKQLSNSKDNRNYNLLFWISLGLLAFYPFCPIIFIILVYFDYSIFQSLYIDVLHQFLICLMYTCFIIGFLKMHYLKPIWKEDE